MNSATAMATARRSAARAPRCRSCRTPAARRTREAVAAVEFGDVVGEGRAGLREQEQRHRGQGEQDQDAGAEATAAEDLVAEPCRRVRRVESISAVSVGRRPFEDRHGGRDSRKARTVHGDHAQAAEPSGGALLMARSRDSQRERRVGGARARRTGVMGRCSASISSRRRSHRSRRRAGHGTRREIGAEPADAADAA